LETDGYFRVLLAMCTAGLATAIKRTVLTIYFGKRNFEEYKPKLEAILHDVIIISEIAELAEEAENLPEDAPSTLTEKKEILQEGLKGKRRDTMTGVRWQDVKFHKRKPSEGEEKSDDESDTSSPQPRQIKTFPSRNDYASTSTDNFSGTTSELKRTKSGSIRIKNLLDRWDEPKDMSNKASEASIHDILKFRRALTLLNLETPFGDAYGPASNRNESIQSSANVFRRLLRLSPGTTNLSYDVLKVLAEDDDGIEDPVKQKSLRQLFRPDARNELTRLAFIQSCDTVYKKLRYFRASVGNASVIDNVLLGIIDIVFGFILTLTVLTMVKLNPWPLLVSMSTLLVTFAFAVGPSVAKAIEGIVLIVGRRPFDIGDRIVISDQPGAAVNENGIPQSWFVEDISLFTTTLRFGQSNEVATVSNGSIASARIANCARSANAVVLIVLKLHISLHNKNNLKLYKEAIENFVADNPRVWDGIGFFRCEGIDTDDESTMYKLAIRSRHNWQNAPRIFLDKAELWKFLIDTAEKLGVRYDSQIARRVLYFGGALAEGGVSDFKKNLAHRDNILKHGNSMGSREFGELIQQSLEPSSVADSSTPVSQSKTPGGKNVSEDPFLKMVQKSHG
jgi:small-conductance mechanosensitive channel